MEMTNVGDNVKFKVEGSIMTIEVDLTKEFGLSSSGKTHIIASSCGNAKVPDPKVNGITKVLNAKFGLNVFKVVPKV